MISRRSGRVVAEAYTKRFAFRSNRGSADTVWSDMLYDFLYEHDYPSWLCNASKIPSTVRSLKEFFMKLHTGETQARATPTWSWEQRKRVGQEFLRDLAEDFLNWYHNDAEEYRKRDLGKAVQALARALELDGPRSRRTIDVTIVPG